MLNHDDAMQEIAPRWRRRATCCSSAAAPSYPIALEGALKLKEISYIHAEGYAAGEMKHGPIALIDENVPVIVAGAAATSCSRRPRPTCRKRSARGGKVMLLSDAEGIEALGGRSRWRRSSCPRSTPSCAPILYAIPVQLLAYHAAVAKGTDVDQPRNLAKSVTVE